MAKKLRDWSAPDFARREIVALQETKNAMIIATMASVREIPSTQRTTPVVRPCRALVAVLKMGGLSDMPLYRRHDQCEPAVAILPLVRVPLIALPAYRLWAERDGGITAGPLLPPGFARIPLGLCSRA
jgi:hypothetical protein